MVACVLEVLRPPLPAEFQQIAVALSLCVYVCVSVCMCARDWGCRCRLKASEGNRLVKYKGKMGALSLSLS